MPKEIINEIPFSRSLSYTDRALKQIAALRTSEAFNISAWNEWLNHIGRSDLAEKWNLSHRGVYWSAEYGLPGIIANGGLGMLSRDHFLDALSGNEPTIFLGLAYSERKNQRIRDDGQGNFEQQEDTAQMPEPESLRMHRMTQLDATINGDWGANGLLPVYRYPLSTQGTNLFLLQVPGEVYPTEKDSDRRLWNNVVLGFGGYKIVKKLIDKRVIAEPAFYHFNESATVLGGLAAFDDLVYQFGDNQEAFTKALSVMREKTVLSNHTLVQAAEAWFSQRQYSRFVINNLKSSKVAEWLNHLIDINRGTLKLLDIGFFLAGRYNGVSQDHAARATKIFRETYGKYFPGQKAEFTGITNGIYEQGWNPQMFEFLLNNGVIDQYGMTTPFTSSAIEKIDSSELLSLKNTAVQRLQKYLEAGNKKDQFGNLVKLPQDAIIVGDARRVAEYKRRWMMFNNPDRLKKILESHPKVHVIMSGKAHPADKQAKDELSYILGLINKDPSFRERIHFLADYDAEMMSFLGPACHVWLNTPRVGEEACGTSGMKTGLGASLQVSTPDGFYAELPQDSYFAIGGATNSNKEKDNYYEQLEKALTSAENPQTWTDEVKKMWKAGFLNITSGARMRRDYANFYFPH